MTYKEKLEKIFDKHGTSNQLKKLSEEVFELQEAITIYDNDLSWIDDEDTLDEDGENIIKEFADVLVLLNQIMLAYNLDENDIISTMKAKIDRQCERDGINGND